MNDNDPLTKEELTVEYHHLLARKVLLLVVCIIGIILVVGLLSFDTYPGISLRESYEIIWNHIVGNNYPKGSLYWWADRQIWNSAIPHAIVAIIAGCSLAVCGALMQSLMTNPLADPYSTGISSGACFGAVAAIIMGITMNGVVGEAGTILNAFVGAMIPALLIILISQKVRMTPATLILLGTAISYFFNSLITYMMITTDADTLKSAYLWQVGSLDGMTWDYVPLMFVITVIGSVFVMYAAHTLNVMSLGENSAISLGVDVEKFRMLCLMLMSVMTAAIVAFTGILGFVGLVAPHIVRLVIGSDNKYVIPISMAVGALLLLIADYIASRLSGIPVGVVLSVIGSPVFFILIVWQGKRTGAVY